MSKPKSKSLDANRRQGSSVAEREGVARWGGPDISDSPLPLDQCHYRREYMGFGELPQDTRRQPAMPGDELARTVVNLSAPQLVHAATRGMPGKRDFSDGTGRATGRIRAVHRFGGLGPQVHRVADAGRDPADQPVDVNYLREPAGPRPDVLAKYVAAASLVPTPTGPGSGYPRHHELSALPVAGDDILAAVGQ